MTPLTEERDTAKREGKIIVRGVKTGVTILAGAMVARNAAGYALPAADAAGLTVEGRAAKTVDNSDGQDGDLQVEIEQGFFLYDSAGLTAADAGKDCYAADDHTVNLTGGSNHVFAGVIGEVVSETEVWVKMGISIRGPQGEQGDKGDQGEEGPVPEATVVAAVASPAAGTQGAGYVQADVQRIATLADENKAQLNAVIAALKAAGLMASV